MLVSEDFLYFIWKFRLYSTKLSTCWQSIEVLDPGVFNIDAGPDFSCAKIKIENVLWVGQVEIHVKASDWILHDHHCNEAYDNVILHVVYENDRPIYRRNGTPMPVLELKGLIDTSLVNKHQQLMKSFNSFPCEKHLGFLDQSYVNSFLSRILIERLEEKATDIKQVLLRTKNDWTETFYIMLAKNFGFKVNALPFELLANSISHCTLARYKDRPICVEALIFGQAGLLNDEFNEEYPRMLKAEYMFLSQKHSLKPISVSMWKFLRMRPKSFPTLRLAQFAALILKSSNLFSQVLDTTEIRSMVSLFEALPVNPYWKTHYHFNKEAAEIVPQPGRNFIYNIIINTVCQALYTYGKYTDEQQYKDRAIQFLEQLSAEKNVIVKQYEACGLKIDAAYLSQALLQLNKKYCNEKKCLNCSIGMSVIRR